MDNILIVIDVQEVNPIDTDFLDKVIREINMAIHQNWRIILVEIDMGYSTCNQIMDIIKSYDKYDTVLKDANDGSNELHQFIHKNKIKTNNTNFFVCGMYTDFCILETIQNVNFTVAILSHACWEKNKNNGAIEKLSKMKHVTIM